MIGLIRGVAVPLPAWPGAELGHHPVRIDVDGGVLYWDAPEPVSGPLEVTGTVSSNTVDAPDGFPETTGVIRELRMVWHDVVVGPDGSWAGTSQGPRYEEVASTYLPPYEPEPLTPEVEAELSRRARQAYERETVAGRLSPGDPFRIGLRIPHTDRALVPGTQETRWTGVLMDLETVASTGQ
jgi:hypothetical protein